MANNGKNRIMYNISYLYYFDDKEDNRQQNEEKKKLRFSSLSLAIYNPTMSTNRQFSFFFVLVFYDKFLLICYRA